MHDDAARGRGRSLSEPRSADDPAHAAAPVTPPVTPPVMSAVISAWREMQWGVWRCGWSRYATGKASVARKCRSQQSGESVASAGVSGVYGCFFPTMQDGGGSIASDRRYAGAARAPWRPTYCISHCVADRRRKSGRPCTPGNKASTLRWRCACLGGQRTASALVLQIGEEGSGLPCTPRNRASTSAMPEHEEDDQRETV